jgi:hypothetical protein
MGTVNYTRTQIYSGNQIIVTWASLSTGSGTADTGQAFPSSLDYAIGGWLFSDKSIQVFARSTGTVDTQTLIEGSNVSTEVDPTALTYATLTDPQGNALLFANATMPRIEGVLENCMFLRPRVTTVSSTSMAVDVHLLLTSVRNARSGM